MVVDPIVIAFWYAYKVISEAVVHFCEWLNSLHLDLLLLLEV